MKIKYYPNQPHCFAFGGFEIQMLDAFDSVKKLGVEAEKLDIWSRDNDFDILHVWGFDYHTFNVINWAKLSGKKVIATVLLSYFDSYRKRISYYKNYNHYHFLKKKYNELDALVVVNDIQADIANRFYGVEKSKIEIIPNIIKEPYFVKPKLSFSGIHNISGYLLSVGNICIRKNQLKLAELAIKLDKKLVLIGKPIEGENEYAEQLEKLIKGNENILWIKELTSGSEELVSAYYDSKLFILLSDEETQPISVLEAIAANKPTILLNKTYAKQSCFQTATLCNNDFESIENHINRIFSNNIYVENTNVLNCTKENVGMKYEEVYKKMLTRK